jgi:hypothetical protein
MYIFNHDYYYLLCTQYMIGYKSNVFQYTQIQMGVFTRELEEL